MTNMTSPFAFTSAIKEVALRANRFNCATTQYQQYLNNKQGAFTLKDAENLTIDMLGLTHANPSDFIIPPHEFVAEIRLQAKAHRKRLMRAYALAQLDNKQLPMPNFDAQTVYTLLLTGDAKMSNVEAFMRDMQGYLTASMHDTSLVDQFYTAICDIDVCYEEHAINEAEQAIIDSMIAYDNINIMASANTKTA